MSHNSNSLYTLQTLFELDNDFKFDDQSSINVLAWMGDNILQNLASEYLWKSVYSGDLEDEGFLSIKRSKLVCNRSLALFLDNCTNIRVASEGNEHSKGTLFEYLLYKSHQISSDTSIRAFMKYVKRMDEPDMLDKLTNDGFVHDFDDDSWEYAKSVEIGTENIASMSIVKRDENIPLQVILPKNPSKRKLNPRPYQSAAQRAAISQNTIINIRTGGGKTFIAVLVVDYFLNLTAQKKVLFIVPSRALVTQQSEYLRTNTSFNPSGATDYHLKVSEMSGNEFGCWDRSKWRKSLREYDVFVGTAEIFRLALVDQGFISPSDFSLVVFDECHNAVGNHPMAAILRDSILRADDADRPRILGLTASFVNGSMKNVVEKRAALEALFNATLFTPDTSDDTSSNQKSFTQVQYNAEDLTMYREVVVPVVEGILGSISCELGKDFDKWVNKGFTVFVDLGVDGLRFWLREGVIAQLEAFCEEMKKRSDNANCRLISSRLQSSMGRARLTLQHHCLNLHVDAGMGLPAPTFFSQKVVSLLQLLWTLIGSKTRDIRGKSSTRGIVFVEQVALTYPIAFLVNRFFSQMRSNCALTTRTMSKQDLLDFIATSHGDYKSTDLVGETMLPVSGANSMLDRIRIRNLDLFRTGQIPILVSTNALEEGIDVPECDFIIRFDAFTTTKSHIQGSGRARCQSAKIFYFDNCPTKECSNADLMEEIGRNDLYKLSQEELHDSLQEVKRQSCNGAYAPVNYPFRPPSSSNGVQSRLTPISTTYPACGLIDAGSAVDGSDPLSGEVNFFNCLSIFLKYVQRVMKQSFEPDSLFQWRREVIRDFPLEARTVLDGVNFPSPTGFQEVSAADVDKFWSGYKIEEVVQPVDRYEKLTSQERDKRRAVYVVVLRLHALGLLTSCNDPSAHSLAATKYACDAMVMGNKLNLKNRFPADLLPPARNSQYSPSSSHTPAIAPHPATARPSIAVAKHAAVTTGDEFTDYKSLLQRLVQQKYPHCPPNLMIRYSSVASPTAVFRTPCQFCSEVVLEQWALLPNVSATGKYCLKKKEAEQSAAHALLLKIGLI